MKLTNLKVGSIGLIIFCVVVVVTYLWNKQYNSKEHFNAPDPIVPWNTETHRYTYRFRMIYKKSMRDQYNSLLYGAFERFKHFTKQYFDTYCQLSRNENNISVSVTNRQVAIQFVVIRVEKATNKQRVGRIQFNVNLNRLNDQNDTQFYASLKKMLADHVQILM